MKDHRKSKKQLLEELEGLKQRISEFDRTENECNQTEKLLRENEVQYRSIFANSLDAILLTAPDGQILTANPEACSMLGYTEAELQKIGRAGVVDPADPRLPPALEERMRTGKFKGELTLVRRDGSKFEAELSTLVFRGPDGFERTSMIFRDITERKHAEAALQESERRFRQLAENIEAVFWMESADGSQLHYISPAFEMIWGFPVQDLMRDRNRWLEAIHPEDRPRISGWVDGYHGERQFGAQEFRIIRPDGKIRWVSNRAFPIRNERGEIYRVAGFVEDITGRKEMEEELRKNREFLTLILDNSPMLIYVTSLDHRYRLVNRAWEEFVTKNREEVIGHSIEEIFSSKIAKSFMEQNQQVIEQYLPSFIEEEVLTPLGTRHFYTMKFPLIGVNGKVEGVGGISLDITEKRQGEEKIREMSRFLETVIDNANIWIDVLDKNANIVIWNKGAELISGYSSQEVIGHSKIWEWLYSEEAEWQSTKRRVIQLMQKGGEKREREFETTIRTKAGGKKIISWYSRNLVDDKGIPIGSVVLGQDVTERRRAEEELREMNQYLQALIQASPLAIVAANLDKKILRWNSAAERIFGWREQEVIGQPVPIIPEDKEAEFQEIFEKVLKGRIVSGFETLRQKKDGTLINVSLSTAPLYGAHRKVEGSMAILEDIGERKRAEKMRQQLLDQLNSGRRRLRELSRRLVELQETERRDLSRELHDDVGQNLTALSINLNIIENLLPEGYATKINDRIYDSYKLIEETVRQIRDVMARLRPPVLDDYGLVAALNWYANQFKERTGIAIAVRGEELAARLPLTVETALFRIAQEALNNAAKHAKASEITLTVEVLGERVRLDIVDNGVGFDPETHHQMGAKPEWGLINMRERAESFGGEFRIETAPGKGTKIVVEVPKQT